MVVVCVCILGVVYGCGLCMYSVCCMVVVCVRTRCGVWLWSVYVLGVVYSCGLCMY